MVALRIVVRHLFLIATACVCILYIFVHKYYLLHIISMEEKESRLNELADKIGERQLTALHLNRLLQNYRFWKAMARTGVLIVALCIVLLLVIKLATASTIGIWVNAITWGAWTIYCILIARAFSVKARKFKETICALDREIQAYATETAKIHLRSMFDTEEKE